MWTAELNQGGCFEAVGLMELKNDMVNFYADQEDAMPQIKSLFWISNSGMECRASERAVNCFEDTCHLDIHQTRIEIELSKQAERDLRSDYYRSVL